MTTTDSVGDFVSKILSRDPDPEYQVVYRGHEDSAFVLQPSVFRSNLNQQNEHLLLRELIAVQPQEFATDTSTLEVLVRMQHYSLPTRLLDVSSNPLVGLYFACQPHRKRVLRRQAGSVSRPRIEADGEVVILTVPRARVRYFDSDTVSCLANLARLRWNLKEDIDTDQSREAFNGSLPIKRLLHFIRQEKSGFEPEIRPRHLTDVFLVKPKQNNRRILAQDGSFFIFGLTDKIEETNSHRISVERIRVPGRHKATIIGELDKLAVNEKTMFPEIDRAAQYVTRTLTTNSALADL